MDAIEKSSLLVQKQQNDGITAVDLIENHRNDSANNRTSGRFECASKEKDSRDFGSEKVDSEGKVEEVGGENLKLSDESLWEKFAKTTTGHGFARMVDKNEPLKFRIFWAVAVFFLTVGLFTSVLIISYDPLVVRGLRREFTVQHNSSLDLPDIHICDTSLFNATILKEMGFNNSLASYMALALSPYLVSHQLKEDHQRRQQLELNYQRLIENTTMHEVFDKAILKCEDIILGCTRNTVAYSGKQCCNRFFGPDDRYPTDLATLCYSTRSQPPLEELFVSQIYGFTVYLKTSSHSRFEFDATIISSNVASRRGIIYSVSNRNTGVNPSISTSGYYITPGTWTSVSISLTRTDNSELSDGVLSPYSCADARSKHHIRLTPSYEAYSERNCFFSTARSVLEAKLNCSRFRFTKRRNVTRCEPKMMIDVYSSEIAAAIKEKSNICPKDCIFDDYCVFSSTTQLHLGDQDDMQMQGEVQDDNMTHSAIHFFYPSFTYTVIKNHPQSIVKWLSEVGGNMSLFVGASFVTLIELIILAIRFVRDYFLQGRPVA